MNFTTPAPLGRALDARGYTEATPVQAAVLEERAQGRDLLVSARTGSGKTVAYGLAIGDTLLQGEERLGRAGAPLALIVAPTRELAQQVHQELVWLYAETGARVISCVGGMDPREERRQLGFGAHIVVGTPGRLRDHLERRNIDLTELRAVVLDEADEMLDLGFREDLEFILAAAPEGRRTLLFSATLPPDIISLATRFQRDALRIAISAAERGHADIEYRAMRVVGSEFRHAVVNTLRHVDSPSAIVFCNTRRAVGEMHAALQERGFAVVALSGEMGQNERNAALQSLRDGRARVCVATDVAARGIDLPGLGLVIHADLPHDPEVLQHRSGRTGRAGRKGVSVMLVAPSRMRKAEALMRAAGIEPVWSSAPSADAVRELDRKRLLADPILSEVPSEEDLAVGRELLQTHTPERLAAILARFYRLRLPAAEEVTELGASRESRTRPEALAKRGRKDAPKSTVWFRLSLGRAQNADPKWLLPMICRRGDVDRDAIGSIRIFDGETAFEVASDLAPHFAQAAGRPDGDNVRIEQLGADWRPPARSAPRGRPRPRSEQPAKPFRKSERGERKPYAEGKKRVRQG
ncbi:DEAD/DEAH box helicase [Lutibaculum baratangense]|uniref:DEAD/DEAH box helicase n=1 Tax=Lutibaculum baratangense TaxID=1358440 RepID=UPI0006854823|nr:DEAD/DEAH box helicase [Lutibaculum baratangense]